MVKQMESKEGQCTKLIRKLAGDLQKIMLCKLFNLFSFVKIKSLEYIMKMNMKS